MVATDFYEFIFILNIITTLKRLFKKKVRKFIHDQSVKKEKKN